jgi:hypothetical protein
MWARPTDGLDPGDDWKLSTSDQCYLLNEFAGLILDGKLSVGDVLHRTFDGELASVTITVGEPVDPDEVEAFGARGSQVLPLRWSLDRPPVGVAEPLTEVVEREQRAQLGLLLTRIDHPSAAPGVRQTVVRGPGVARPAPDASLAPDQAFGPLTPLVQAQALAVANAPADLLAEFAMRHLEGELVAGRGHAQAMSRAIARSVWGELRMSAPRLASRNR